MPGEQGGAVVGRPRVFSDEERKARKAEYVKRWREANRDRVRVQAKAWREANAVRISAQSKAYHAANRDAVSARKKVYRAANRAALAAKNKAYNEINREKLREKSRVYREANREKRQAAAKVYRENNRSAIAAYRKEWKKRRYRSDVAYSLEARLRARAGKAIRLALADKSAGTLSLLGCTPQQLISHIESRWLPGMTWGNRHLWEVDHITPIAAFDLTDPEQQKACFCYENLRPLWTKDNKAKSDLLPNGKRGRESRRERKPPA